MARLQDLVLICHIRVSWRTLGSRKHRLKLHSFRVTRASTAKDPVFVSFVKMVLVANPARRFRLFTILLSSPHLTSLDVREGTSVAW